MLESRWFLALVVQFEILLGLWLISGLFACAAWWVALWTFGVFTVVAAAKGIAGEPLCGCFGRVETSPWLTLTMDIAAVIALCYCAVPGLPSGRKASTAALPGIGSPSDTASAAAGFSRAHVWLLGLWLTTASGLGFFSVRGAALAPLAAIGQRVGDVILVQPDQMVGQPFALSGYVDIGQQFAHGRWLVVFYNARCPECERLKEYWSTSWSEIRGQGNTAFVSVPPDLTATTPALHGVRWGSLDSGIDWFIQTPLVVAIQDKCMITGIAFWFGWTGIGDRANRDDFPLVLRPEDVDFGEAFMQEEFPWQLQIENTSAHPARILDFGSSCACTSINPSSVVVPGQGTASIELVLDTTGNWKDGEVDHPRAFAIDLWPILQGPRRPVPRWTIKGRVSRPLAFSPPAVLYGETLVQGRHLPEKTVLVRASEGVERLAIDCDWPSVRLEAGPSDSSGSGWFEISVSPGEQTPPIGTFEVDVRVIGVLSGGQRLPPVPLRLAGLVVPEFYAIPHTIRLLPVAQGEPATVDVVLQSRVDGEFAVEQIVNGASGVVIEPQHIGLGRVHKFRVARVAPTSDASEKTITFLVRTDTGERKHVDVTLVEIP